MTLCKKIITAIIIFIPYTTSAQEKIETDRPGQTESSFIVLKNYFQFEFGMNMEKDKKMGTQTTTFFHPTSLLKYGLNENIELRIQLEPYTLREKVNNQKTSSTLIEPVEVGFKARLWEEKGAIPKTSFIFHTSVPFLSSKQFQQQSVAPTLLFTCQNTLSKKWILGYNAGMAWDGEDTKPTYAYTIAPGFEINDKFSGFFELYGFISNEENPQHSFDAGLYYYPKNDVKLDISAGVGLTKEAPDFYVAIGCSFRFKH